MRRTKLWTASIHPSWRNVSLVFAVYISCCNDYIQFCGSRRSVWAAVRKRWSSQAIYGGYPTIFEEYLSDHTLWALECMLAWYWKQQRLSPHHLLFAFLFFENIRMEAVLHCIICLEAQGDDNCGQAAIGRLLFEGATMRMLPSSWRTNPSSNHWRHRSSLFEIMNGKPMR